MDAQKVYVIVPNWNGADRIGACLSSLKAQSQDNRIVVVDNGSVDDSLGIIEKDFPEAIVINHTKNKGFAGGVNAGIRYAIEEGAKYVALLNNDAVAEKEWLKQLIMFMDAHPKAAAATSKILDRKGMMLDSTGEMYSIWGMAFPRGRGEKNLNSYDGDSWVFGASGGATVYRIKALEQIGMFDEDFFAYFEDADISFRAQLAGWKIAYVPGAVVHHEIGATSATVKGMVVYQTIKNLPWLMWKNVPWRLMPKVFPRFVLVYSSIAASGLRRGQIGPVLKGVSISILLWPKKLVQRYEIQRKRRVSVEYISSMVVHDLPPDAAKLRRLRGMWWKLWRRPA